MTHHFEPDGVAEALIKIATLYHAQNQDQWCKIPKKNGNECEEELEKQRGDKNSNSHHIKVNYEPLSVGSTIPAPPTAYFAIQSASPSSNA